MGPFHGIFNPFGRQILAFLANISFRGFKSLELVDVTEGSSNPEMLSSKIEQQLYRILPE